MFGVKKDFKIHFIGIGGIGMSGIAEVLLNLGYKVSGSDLNESANVLKLREHGAEVFIGHEERNINDVQIVVYSSAINYENPEIKKALELKLPIIKRAEMLAELMRLKYGVAIAGSHGKTTTTSFVSTIFQELGMKPTCIVGGIVKNLGGQAVKGDGEYLIAEADESDGSFLLLNPIMSAITNIDNDHLDYYGTEEKLQEAFTEYSNKIPFYGKMALNCNDENTLKILKKIRRPYVLYGINNHPDYTLDYMAKNIVHSEEGTNFVLVHKKDEYNVKISLSGEHNVLNALAAISISHQSGLKLEDVTRAIGNFEGVARRFEILYKKDNFVIVDDYGHHPTEIKATLKTAKKKYPQSNIIAIFEPHRFSRTKEHWKDFVDSFKEVEKAYVSPIYPASEKPIDGITSENLVADMGKQGCDAELFPNWDNMKNVFEKFKNEKTVILCLGAGSISKITRNKIEEWKSTNL